MKKINTLIILLIVFGTVSAFAKTPFTVVIDAGHGGRDGGAVRGKIKEKDINLAVALNLGRLIENNYKDVKIVYTRKTDVFVDLYKRADIANKAKANLFISIHTNSTEARTTSASGADTYILGLGRSEENMRVAQRENSVILLEDNYKQRYENFDPKSPESYIIFEFMTNKYMDQSLEFASNVQADFKNIAKRVDRGVKQAGFLVLRNTASPSVLIELGFINNPSEAKYLTSTIGQRAMASAIYSGFKKYKKAFDAKGAGSNPVLVSNSTSAVKQQSDTSLKQESQSRKPSQSGTTFVSKPKKDPVRVASTSPKTNQAKPSQTASGAKVQNKPAVVQQSKSAISPNDIEYRVQILISNTPIDKSSPRFKGLSPINVYMDGRTYKYTYGSTTDQNEGLRLQRHARTKFKDAFMIKFKDGKRIK